MNPRRILMYAYLYVTYGFRKVTGTGPFGPNRVEYLYGPIHADGNPLKASLLKHHVKQFHGSSCSVASVVSAVNAIRDEQVDSPVPISQMDILDKVKTANWKERMTDKGYKGRRGLPLPVLGDVVKSSLDAYGLRYKAAETVPAPKNPHQSKKIGEVLRDRKLRTAFSIIKIFQTNKALSSWSVTRLDLRKSSEIYFYLSNGLKIILDDENIEKKLHILSLLLTQITADLDTVRYIDLRFKEPIVGKK